MSNVVIMVLLKEVIGDIEAVGVQGLGFRV